MDQVMSMELGADDYMQKPFYTNVLIAKLQAIYRRVYEFTAEEKRTLTGKMLSLIYQKTVYTKVIRRFPAKRNDYFRNSYYQKKSNRFEIQLSLHYGMMKHLLVIIR